MDQLLKQVAYFNKHSAQLCQLLAYTGIRLNGALKLKWERVDPKLKWMRVVEKGSKSRTLHLHQRAADVLRELTTEYAGQSGGQPKGPVFRFGDPKMKASRRHLHKAAKALDSPIKTPHYFRHWFATQALIQGVDVRTLAGVLGHTDGGALLLRTYGHLCDRSAQEMAQKLKF